MNFRDKIARFNNFALTNSLGVYNEDSMTAQELNIKTVNKMKECLLMVDDCATSINNIKEFLGIKYNTDSEELELDIGEKVKALKEQVNTSYVCIFNENAMTQLELAGQTAKAVNECVKAVNMLGDLVLEINNIVAINYSNNDEMLTIFGGEENE